MANDSGSGIACPACGHTNDANARFCNGCGGRIDGVCPSCGAANAAGSRFCNQCGHDMTSAASEPSPTAAQSSEAGTAPSAEQAPDARPGPVVEQAPDAGPGPVVESAAPRAVCPRCKHINEPGSQYCFNCGLPLEGEAAFRPGASGDIPAYATGAPCGFWIRLAAVFIDGIILAGALAILTPILFDEVYFDAESGGALAFDLAVRIGYPTLLIGLWGATLGKRVLGMRIVRSDGSPVSIPRALGRTLASILSGILLFVGYLMVAFRADKRALHDLIADTVVIRR